MEFRFETIPFDDASFLENTLPQIPKRSGVYRIFDLHGKLIVLDKSSNLFHRFQRFYGPRPEPVRHLDLRKITGRIEYIRTDSTFETLYVLYQARRKEFPKTYRKMRTFRLFTLMKLNRKQRFPRIYTSREIRKRVDYFGPFVTRGQFNRLKTTLERTFKLRPCLYNIRGNDPHPDCLYFQMHTCSRPCNNDIDRSGYLDDVQDAMLFIQGREQEIEHALTQRMSDLAAEMKFEEAELIRRRVEKIHKARREFKDTFFSVWNFNFMALLPSDSASRRKVAFIREGKILGMEEYETASMDEHLDADLRRYFESPIDENYSGNPYDEFCLVCNFILKPLKSVELRPV